MGQVIAFRKRQPVNPMITLAADYFIGMTMIALLALAVFEQMTGSRRG